MQRRWFFLGDVGKALDTRPRVSSYQVTCGHLPVVPGLQEPNDVYRGKTALCGQKSFFFVELATLPQMLTAIRCMRQTRTERRFSTADSVTCVSLALTYDS